MRSALESVKGVKSAKVSLEREEAIVVYDPKIAKEEDLIQSVRNANGMHPYDARVKRTEK